MFSHRKSDHYGEALLSQIWKRACDAVGINVTLYEGVRHSFAMQLLKAGKSYKEIAAYLGHSDVRTTRRYGRLDAEPIRLDIVEERASKIVSLEEARQKKKRAS